MASDSTIYKLPDEILENIVLRIDLKSKLNLMLVSKRFYHLVKDYPTLYENFRLKLHGGSKLESLPSSRYFNSITLSSFQINQAKFEAIKQLLTKIGSKFKKVDVHFVTTEREMLNQIFELIPNAESISISNLTLTACPDFFHCKPVTHNFTKLKKLNVDGAPDFLYDYLFSRAVNIVELKAHTTKLLINKPNLKSLKFKGSYCLHSLEIPHKVDFQLTHLELDRIRIRPLDIEYLVDIFESQKQIKDFVFDCSYLAFSNMDFSGILLPILNLKSLERFETRNTNISLFSKARDIRNPNVKELVISNSFPCGADFLEIVFKIFPRLKKLEIQQSHTLDENANVMNKYLNYLEEIYIKIARRRSSDTLESLKISSLKKFHWRDSVCVLDPNYVCSPKSYEIFAKNNSGVCELSFQLRSWMGYDAIEVLLTNLPHLRSFIMINLYYNEFNLEDRLYEMVGKHGKNLKFLQFVITQHKKKFEGYLLTAVYHLIDTHPDLVWKYHYTWPGLTIKEHYDKSQKLPHIIQKVQRLKRLKRFRSKESNDNCRWQRKGKRLSNRSK